jgi:hypothetical protein
MRMGRRTTYTATTPRHSTVSHERRLFGYGGRRALFPARRTAMSAEQDRIARTRAALADFVRIRADWRADRASEWPEDPRNARSANALYDLESWVLALPDSDDRLRQLAAHYPEDIAFIPAGERAAHFASRYGFTFVANPHRFLGVFLALTIDQEARGYDEPLEPLTDAATRRIDLADTQVDHPASSS